MTVDNMNKCQESCGFISSSKICKICIKKNEYEKRQKIKMSKLIQINKSKCWKCKKRISISAIQCRCKYYFCDKHRYPEEHSCLINYKKLGLALLKKNVIKCQSDKFEKI